MWTKIAGVDMNRECVHRTTKRASPDGGARFVVESMRFGDSV